MAVAEATQSRHALRAAALAATLLLAKAFALAGNGGIPPLLTIPAYVWQDVAVALLFWAVDRTLGRPRWLWFAYAAIAGYAIVNVPVVATLGSPLTPAMVRAAGAAIGNSMWTALTPVVLLQMTTVAAVALAAPRIQRSMRRFARPASAAVGLIVVVTGAATARSIDTNGLHRTPLAALFSTTWPRIHALPGTAAQAPDFRTSPFGAAFGQDLRHLHASGRGLNVLLIALESTAARYLAPYGAADDPMPSVTALARESIVFDAAYAAYPESVKGFFSVLCATAPAVDVPAETHAGVPCDSMVNRLHGAGYRTSLFHAGRFGYLGMKEILAHHRFDSTEDAGAIGGNVESSFGVDEPAVIARILSWVDHTTSDRPFFAMYMPVAGHHPYESSSDGPFRRDTGLGAYKNAIHEGDRALGTLFAGLRERGLLDRTLVVLYGDHGEAFDQHAGNRAHSLYIYDENVRVPLIMRLPSSAGAAGTRVRRVASVLDIGPTILDLIGIATQQNVEGSSLLDPRERMALFHADYDRVWLGLRDGCWKFLFEAREPRPRLFDICGDADETRDVSGQHAARVAAYRTHLDAWAAWRRGSVLGADARR